MAARSRVKRAPREAARKALARGVAVSLALGEIACSAPAQPVAPPIAKTTATATATQQPTAAPVVTAVATAEPAQPVPDPSEVLKAYAVTNQSYSRRTLYTWTTADQIDELLRTRVLLSRTESPTRGTSFYDRTMESLWLGGDKIAALLRAPAFLRARFAWPAAWATMLGWPGESYGDQLIEVTLKPEAWILMYRTSTSKWEVRDMKGAVVQTSEVLARPDRVGAVHFVHDSVSPPSTTAPPRTSSGDGREAYREYVLCNESMIESWSVGSDRVATEITAGADVAAAAAKYFDAHPIAAQRADRWNVHVALLVWPGLVETASAKELYEAALAFPNPNYVIEPEALQKIATAMRSASQRAKSTTHKPVAAFPGAKPVPIPPPPPPPPPSQIKKWRGTY